MICYADSERVGWWGGGFVGRGFADTHHEISGRAPVTKKNMKQHLKVLQVDMKDAKAALQKAEKKKEPVMQHHALINFLFSLQAVWYLVEKLLQNKHVKAAVIYFDVKSHKEWRATHPSDPRIQSFSHAAVTEEIAFIPRKKKSSPEPSCWSPTRGTPSALVFLCSLR